MKYYFSLPRLFTLTLIILINSILHFAIAQTPIPNLNNGVMDSANVLKASEKAKLDEIIMQFERESGSQLAVLIIPQLNNEDIVDYGVRVMEQWKLGRKDIDDGVLLIISINDRKMRLEVGYGLEGAIPDVTAAKILNEYLAPHFKNQNYYQGINQAIDAIIALVKQEPLPSVQAKPVKNKIRFVELFGKILEYIFLGIILLIACGMFLLYFWVLFTNLKNLFSKSPSQSSYSSDDRSYRSDDSRDSGYSRDSDSSSSSSSSSSDDRSGGGGRSGGSGATGGW